VAASRTLARRTESVARLTAQLTERAAVLDAARVARQRAAHDLLDLQHRLSAARTAVQQADTALGAAERAHREAARDLRRAETRLAEEEAAGLRRAGRKTAGKRAAEEK
jgi:hypothetical protein